MDLTVDDSAMRSLVAKAILDSLTPDAREKLVTDAIRQTLTVPKDSGGGYYGNKRSPLQQAFDLAVENEARRHAAETIANDEQFKSQLQSLFADVAKRVFESQQRDELVDSIAKTIVKALTADRY